MWFLSGFLMAVSFSVPLGLLSLVRAPKGYNEILLSAIVAGVLNFVILFTVDVLIIFCGHPMMTFVGLSGILWVNLLVTVVVATVADLIDESPSLGLLSWLALLVFSIICIVGYNSGHNAYNASHIVSVTEEGANQLPASSTTNMVIVSSDIATTRAQQTMSTGIANTRNFNTYLNLGPATLQYVDGHMWYVFPLEFDGSGNKKRLHAISPGYIMISAEDPNAAPVEHYDNQYSMVVSLGAGQGGDPFRWAWDHGYDNYMLDDPTLEINDQGLPFYTVTLLRPKIGWTFDAPVGVLLINAHTGQITKYNLNDVPDWVDRVYSSSMAESIVDWYGLYHQGTFPGIGSSYAGRFQVSGSPVLVYTGGGHPDWRMLLTSFNNDSSVSKIVLMDAHSGAMRVYDPQGPMGVEGPVYDSFNNASGTGASLIKANHYQAVDLTLHVIYGHLTWMATYEPSGVSNPSFVGLGFLDAYNSQANNVAFGNNKAAALQNYLTQLASEANANGNAPGQGSQLSTVTGVIAPNGVNWDVTGGQKYWYISLVGDINHVYTGTVSNLGPALAVAQPGDHVVISYLQVSTGESALTMNSFTDQEHPLSAAGS